MSLCELDIANRIHSLAAVRIVSYQPLSRIPFESDCLVLVQDVFSQEARIGWQAEEWMTTIRSFFLLLMLNTLLVGFPDAEIARLTV